MSDSVWSELHDRYKKLGLDEKPNIFAEEVLSYLPDNGKLLDLGAGLGQDSTFFASKGYEVTATDVEESALAAIKKPGHARLQTRVVDLKEPLPFKDGEFDIVYAHLSLHYFEEAKTKAIFKEIRRVLKQGGVIAFLVNSTNDPEFGTGKEVEAEFFEVGNKFKRYFSLRTAESFTELFQSQLLDDKGETYKDAEKDIHNLIRFVGKKLPSLEEIGALHRKYAPTEQVFHEIYQHCKIVSEFAEWCIEHGRTSDVDRELVRIGALLHDIGVYKLYTVPGQLEGGNYITHGIRGYEILKTEGFAENLCRFASRHTGVGITAEEITANKLPLPAEDFVAETEEEQLVMFADKFHSKDPSQFNSVIWMRNHFASKFGAEKAQVFDDLVDRYGEPPIEKFAEKYKQTIR